MLVWSELEFAITSPSFVTLYHLVSEIAKCIAWGCLLLFNKNYIVYYNVYCFLLWCVHWKVCVYQVSSWLVIVWVIYMAIYVSIIMYCLRLFIVVLQELHCLQTCNFPIPWSLRISNSTQKFRFSTLYGYWDTLVETEEEEEQQQQQQQQQGENEELWKWTFTILTPFLLSDFGHFLRTPILWP